MVFAVHARSRNLPIYVSGSSFNNNIGLWMLGTNTKTMCPTFNLDLRTCATPYVFEAGSYAMFESVKLADKVLCATNDVPLVFGQLNDSGSYDLKRVQLFFINLYPLTEQSIRFLKMCVLCMGQTISGFGMMQHKLLQWQVVKSIHLNYL